MKRVLLLLLLCWIHGLVRNVRAQEYFYYDADTVRHPVVLFRLNNEQAEKVLFDNGVEDTVLLKSLQVADYNFTSEHIDQDTYEDGYYLTATLSSPYKVSYELLPKIPFHIVYNNKYGGLGVQLLDKKSLAYVENAEVRIGSYKLHYDPAIKSYRTPFDFNSGVLEIKIRDRKYWMALNKQFMTTGVVPQSSVIRNLYAWNVFDLLSSPDAILSIPFNKEFYDYCRGDYYDNSWLAYQLLRSNRHYFISPYLTPTCFFSKPEYRKGDTVRTKIYLECYNNRFYKRPVSVRIDFDKKSITSKLSVAPGDNGYDLEFVLDDSLGITADRQYTIILKNVGVRNRISFPVRQYNLDNYDFQVELPKEDWYRGNIAPLDFKMSTKADIPVYGANLKLIILTDSLMEVDRTGGSILFMPDTLYSLDTVLEDISGYQLYIPDSIFKDRNVAFRIKCQISYGDYTKEISGNGRYWSRINNLVLHPYKGDMRIFNICDKDTLMHPLWLRGYDAFGHPVTAGILRLKENEKYALWHVNQVVESIALTDSITGRTRTFSIQELEDQPVTINSYVDGGKLYISVHNPYGIRYQLFTYRANRELDKIISDEVLKSFTYPYNPGKEHYLFMNALWAGKSQFYSFALDKPDYRLNFEVQHRQKIFPGALDEWQVTVTDNKGKQVKNASLFAYAYTNKFTAKSAFDRFQYLRPGKQKKGGRNYKQVYKLYLEDRTGLQYNTWKEKFRLSEQDYYTMLYKDTVYQEFIYASPDTFSYIIPVVIKNNRIQPVVFVRYNNSMHYMGGADVTQPYAVKISNDTSQTHRIQLLSGDTLYDVMVDLLPREDQKVVKIVVLKPRMAGALLPFSIIPYKYDRALQDLRAHTLAIDRKSEGFAQAAVLLPGYDTLLLSDLLLRDREPYALIAPVRNCIWSYDVNNEYAKESSRLPVRYSITEPRILPGYAYYFESPNRSVLTSLDNSVYRDMLREAGIPRLRVYNSRFEKKYSGVMAEIRDKRYQVLWKRSVWAGMKFKDTLDADVRVRLDYGPVVSDTSYAPDSSQLNILFIKKNDPFEYEFVNADIAGAYRLKKGLYDIALLDSKRMYMEKDIDLGRSGWYHVRLSQPEIYDTLIGGELQDILSYATTNGERGALLIQYLLRTYYKNYTAALKGKVQFEDFPVPGPVWIRYKAFGTFSDSDGNYTLYIPATAIDPDTSLEALYGGENWKLGKALNDDDAVRGWKSNKTHRVIEKNVVLPLEGSLFGIEITERYSGREMQKTKWVGSAGRITSATIDSRYVSGNVNIAGVNAIAPDTLMPLIIVDNKLYNGSILAFSEKVRNTFKVVTDPAYVALYGDAARNGVIFISTKDYDPADLPADIASQTVPGDQPEGTASLRSYFNDAAFWIPHVRTDKYGKAAFTVRYPDDITAWEAAIIATKGRKLRGKYQATVNAFKPLFTTSHLPRFIVEGDSLWFSNTIQNLTPDSLTLLARLSLNDSVVSGKSIALFRSYDDVLLLKAQTGVEHMKVQYEVVKEDGYLDGEVHDLPVLPRGVVVNKGEAVVLNGDTAIFLKQLSPGKEVLVAAYTQQYDIIKEEAMYLFRYRHLCNEQLSAKIIGLVNYIRIRKALDEPVDGKIYKALNRYVELLLQRKKADGTWSWWGEGAADYWVSARAYQALLLAGTVKEMTQPAGFTKATQVYMESRLDGTMDHRSKISLLEILKGLGTSQAYLDTVITRMLDDSRLRPALHTVQRYQLIAMLSTEVMKQYSREFLNYHSDVYGNAYFTADSGSLWNNDMVLNAYALQCLVSQPELNPAVRPGRVAFWLIANRSFNGWRNTYESSLAIQAIARTLDLAAIQKEEVRLCVGNDTITRFPYTGSLNSDAAVKVAKSGYRPVFFSYYYRQRDTLGVHKSDVFAVKTFINRKDTTTCRVGLFEDFELLVEVEVKKDAEFMVLEIPLPAGCIAKAEPARHRYESHREYLDEQVNIALPALKKGTYTFSIPVKAQYKGVFTMNPAKIEMMYMPLNYGTSGVKTIEVR
ncbi:MAG: hypothetical protein BGO09_07590 [Bacteroidetes bacterium 47-18]|nr:MAG: hypothetical protein BGO09_07590 [Bacteroidetes bacterium 47-18]